MPCGSVCVGEARRTFRCHPAHAWDDRVLNRRELLPFLHQLLEQRCRLPRTAAEASRYFSRASWMSEPDRCRPTTSGRRDGPIPASRWTQIRSMSRVRWACLPRTDLGAFSDHQGRVAPGFLVGDGAPRDAELPRILLDDLLDLGVGDRRRGQGGCAYLVAGAGLLAEAAESQIALRRSRSVADVALLPFVLALTDAPADVVASEIAHGERAHREAETNHLVTWQRAPSSSAGAD